MAITCCELVWLVRLLSHLGTVTSAPIKLAFDNNTSLHLVQNLGFYERTKHVEIDCHLIRSHVTFDFINPVHIPSSDQPINLFIKPLFREHLLYLCSKLGVSKFSTYHNLRGVRINVFHIYD